MNDNKKAILDKLKKLSKITTENGATESEVEQALVLMQRLMMKHNLEENCLEFSSFDIKMESVLNTPTLEEQRYWQHDLLIVLCDSYNCRSIRIDYKTLEGELFNYYNLIGFEEDRAIIIDLYDSLILFIRNLYKVRYKEKCQELLKELAQIDMVDKYKKPNQSMFVKSYIKGFLAGLKEKLTQDKKIYLTEKSDQQKYELIVVKKTDLIKDFQKKAYPESKPVTTRQIEIDSDAFYTGKKDGKEKETNKQLH